MTRKEEKIVSSTPVQNQSEVEGWTGQGPSGESWLVSQQQGSISERHKQAQMSGRKKLERFYGTQHADQSQSHKSRYREGFVEHPSGHLSP